MNRLFFLALCLTILLVTGCGGKQTVKDSWKYTKRQYYDYINTPATLDMEDTGSCEPYEIALGERVLDVDKNLSALGRAMENADNNPDQQWVVNMVNRFPWLSGVALLNAEGNLEARYPDYAMKDFNAGTILDGDDKQRHLDLKTFAHMSSLGAEVYVAKPVYVGADLKGYVVAYFDPQQLVQNSKLSGAFMMASPYGLLWSDDQMNSAEVAGADWASIVKSESCGTIGSSSAKYFWTTRYLGNMPIVYAVPATAEPTFAATRQDAPAAPVENTQAVSKEVTQPLGE